MRTNRNAEVAIKRDSYDCHSISSFCDRVGAVVGSVASAGIQSYEVRGGRAIACDFRGSAGSVSITMFPNGETNLPGDTEFTVGRVGGSPNDVELEFSVRDCVTASLLCTNLAASLVFDINEEAQALRLDAASLRQPSSSTCDLGRIPTDLAHIL